MKKVLWVAVIAAVGLGIYAISATAVAQEEAAPEKISPDHEKDIREFLKVTRVESQGRQMMQQMFGQFKRAMPQVPADYWDKFLAKVNFAEFTDMLVPIYGKHMSRDDIKGLTAFFKSPLGQRMLEAQPAIAADSMKVGMAWGQKVAAQVMEDLKKEQQQENPATP